MKYQEGHCSDKSARGKRTRFTDSADFHETMTLNDGSLRFSLEYDRTLGDSHSAGQAI